MRTKPPTQSIDGLSRHVTPNRVEAAALPPRPRKRHWRVGRSLLIGLSGLLVVGIAILGVKVVMASNNIITKNTTRPAPALAGAIDPAKLSGEGEGRINILLLGVGGAGHAGGTLSDTIMVASIDPIQNTVAMLSVPRDLYVQIPGRGSAKINATSTYGGPELAKKVVAGILGVQVHYYVQLDFSGFKQAVNAVGGVEVTNPTALFDPDFPCDNDRGLCGFTLASGPHHLDGTLALRYARCRHGSCGNDFGRAARQQQLILALREKVLQTSTLTNPVTLSNLIDAAGNHIRTDLQVSELQKLAGIVTKLDAAQTTTTVLDTTPKGLLSYGGSKTGAGSILVPKAGAYDYSQIQELARSLFADGYIAKEAATIAVHNATPKPGVEAVIAKQLASYRYHVTSQVVASKRDYSSTVIIDRTGGKKPYTIAYLQKRFKASVRRQAKSPTPSAGSSSAADIDIIVGSDYNVSLASTSAHSAELPTTPNL